MPESSFSLRGDYPDLGVGEGGGGGTLEHVVPLTHPHPARSSRVESGTRVENERRGPFVSRSRVPNCACVHDRRPTAVKVFNFSRRFLVQRQRRRFH